jgi:hypothetical protein
MHLNLIDAGWNGSSPEALRAVADDEAEEALRTRRGTIRESVISDQGEASRVESC